MGLVLLTACAGGRLAQVGEPPMLVICLMNPHCLARDLEKLLRDLKAPPLIDLPKKIDVHKSAGDWKSLEPWERQLWLDYAARGHGRVDSKRADLHVTMEDRLLMGLDLSLQYMGSGAREEGRRLIHDPLFVGGLVGGVTLYILLWLNPEPIFTKGTASIITGALLLTFTVREITDFAWSWNALRTETQDARSLAEIERAAAKFGKSTGARGLHILTVIVGKMAGRAMANLPVPAGGGGPPLAGAAAGGGLVLAEGQQIWVLQGGVIALAGPGALAVAMSAGGDVDLQKHDDSGGHTVKKHVGKTEEDLRARLAAEPKRDEVSTFLSRREAESAVSGVLRARGSEVASWIEHGGKGTLNLEGPFKGGLVLRRGSAACVEGRSVRVVLKGNGAGGWYVFTSYVLP